MGTWKEVHIIPLIYLVSLLQGGSYVGPLGSHSCLVRNFFGFVAKDRIPCIDIFMVKKVVIKTGDGYKFTSGIFLRDQVIILHIAEIAPGAQFELSILAKRFCIVHLQ